ncbi:MAG: HAMP domain-containing histidine kinase [Nevskiaceae bacterium]|nr:MAG: HAMP domain-containing histidine kinase [Nevskiaceae bacterium]
MSRLYTRLFLWFCVANLLTLAISALVLGRIARENYATIQPDWHELATDCAALYESGGPDAVAVWARQLQRRGIHVALLDNGRDLLMAPQPPLMERYLPQLMAGSEIILHPTSSTTLASLNVETDRGRSLRFVALREPPHGRPRMPPYLPRAPYGMLIEITVSLLVIGVVTWRIARGIGTPVEQLQQAARRIATGDLSARIGAPLTDAQDELGQLARDFDHMAHRVESLVERNRWLLRDVSHELRSPLARLQLALELGRGQAAAEVQPYFDRAYREIARVDQLIAQMLALARVEEGAAGIELESIDLAALAGERLAEARMELDRAGLSAELEAPSAVPLHGYPVLLGRALDNLLSNAAKFSPAGGGIVVRVTGDVAGGARLVVEDRGPGVPEGELAQLFSPFFRGSNGPRANGQGLGLAIVERIVQVHGGQCRAANREGGGLTVTLTLPASPPPASA